MNITKKMNITLKIFGFIIFLLCLFSVSCEKSDSTKHEETCTHSNMVKSETTADCTNSGKIIYNCPDCKYSYCDKISDPLGHSFDTTTVAPDCKNGGYTLNKCKCGFSYYSEYTSALDHDYAVIEQAPTCTDRGHITYTCKKCGHTYSTPKGVPTGHQLVSNIISVVNCTEIGETVFTCESCDYTYSEIVYPEGHKFTGSVMMPTLSDMGYTIYSCDTCGFSYEGDLKFYSSIVKNAYAEGTDVLANGIDVSVYQHKGAHGGGFEPLDWQSIANEGIDYVILKAGSTFRENGTLGGVDATFEMDYNDAKAAGLDVGVYFYTYSTSVDQIRNDAYLLLSILDGKQFEYPIYLDLEDDSIRDLGADLLNEMCVEFFTILQRAGYYTGLYVNHEWLYNVIKTDVALSKFDIWYARYPNTETPQWNEDEYGAPFGMWQYTDSGHLPSLGEVAVDRIYAYKNYPDIIKNGGFNGYSAEVHFSDDGKSFVWIKANALNVRSSDDFDSSENIVGYVYFGTRLEVIEISDGCIKVLYDGKSAYISANELYISWTPIIDHK